MNTLRPYLFAVPVLLALSGLTSCSKQTEPAATPELVRGVHVFQTMNQKLPDTVELVGTVHASESATLSAQLMGAVASVTVREGDHVRAGQVLLSIDAAQMASQVEQAHAAVAAAQQQVAEAENSAELAAGTLKRYEMLKAQKSVSPQEFDEVQSRAQAASARLAATRAQEGQAKAAEAAARAMQSYTRIHAPFDGVITERKVDPGAMAAPGVPLLMVEKTGLLRLEVPVDESLLSSIHAGSNILVVIDALGVSPITGSIAQIVPAADAASRSFLVKIELPLVPGLHSGMFGHALLQRGSRDAVVLPRSAIVAHGSMKSVFVVGQNQTAAVRYISAGNAHDDSVEVLSGLSAGESVIDSPGERELSGKRIEVAQ